MRHGEVWATEQGHKVVIVSSDEYNGLPGMRPLVVPVVRERVDAYAAPWVVATCDADPVSGSVVASVVMPAGSLSGPHGMLAGATMAGVQDGLRAVFGL